MIIVSIFLFALSIFMPLLSTRVQLLHENATNINGLLRTLKLAKSDKDLERISDAYTEYENQLNHDSIDYNRFCGSVNIQNNNTGLFYTPLYFLTWHFYAKFIYIIFISLIITYILYL